MIWNNIPQYLKDDLDKIQNEAARIVTGCSKLVSLSNLRQECGWQSLSERRREHILTLFFKMMKGFVPPYLSSLVPQLKSNISNYNLHNANTGFSPEIFEGVVAFSGVVKLGRITNVTQSATQLQIV